MDVNVVGFWVYVIISIYRVEEYEVVFVVICSDIIL